MNEWSGCVFNDRSTRVITTTCSSVVEIQQYCYLIVQYSWLIFVCCSYRPCCPAIDIGRSGLGLGLGLLSISTKIQNNSKILMILVSVVTNPASGWGWLSWLRIAGRPKFGHFPFYAARLAVSHGRHGMSESVQYHLHLPAIPTCSLLWPWNLLESLDELILWSWSRREMIFLNGKLVQLGGWNFEVYAMVAAGNARKGRQPTAHREGHIRHQRVKGTWSSRLPCLLLPAIFT